jgi:hypothetical protein
MYYTVTLNDVYIVLKCYRTTVEFSIYGTIEMEICQISNYVSKTNYI